MRALDPVNRISEPEIQTTNPNLAIPENVILTFCKKWHIKTFGFYGSILREDFHPDSDIDVMIEFSPEAEISLFNLISMQEELELLFLRKVDLVERSQIERSENYIRRIGILSGKPPVLRQMSYFLDMLISARKIEEFTRGKTPDTLDTDEVLYHAIVHNCRFLAISAERIDAEHQRNHPDIPWSRLLDLNEAFESDPFGPGKSEIRKFAWDIIPGIIPVLMAIIPKEDSI